MDHWVKIKESKKKDMYLYLARELRNFFKMRIKVLPIVIVKLERVPKSLKREVKDIEIGEPIKTIQTTALLR